MEQLLSIRKAAGILDLSERKVRDLCIRGDLRASKINGRGDWRIKESDLDGFIQAGYPRQKGA